VNKEGHKETLSPSHPGNTNAVKFGVYSTRLIGERANEIVDGLQQSFELTPVERVAANEAARCVALLEAIDNDLDARGVVDGRGKERSIVQLRVQVSARLERWLDKFASAMERQWPSSDAPEIERTDYVKELQRIALGGDPKAKTSDRLSALKQLLVLGEPEENPGTHVLIVTLDEEGNVKLVRADPPTEDP
jgi:hypothetical protein